MGRFSCEFWLFSCENRLKSADCSANFDFFPAKSADFSANLPLKIPQNFAFFFAKYQKPWQEEKDLVLIIIFVMDALHVTVFLIILHIITSTFVTIHLYLYYFLKNTLLLKKIAKCCPFLSQKILPIQISLNVFSCEN